MKISFVAPHMCAEEAHISSVQKKRPMKGCYVGLVAALDVPVRPQTNTVGHGTWCSSTVGLREAGS